LFLFCKFHGRFATRLKDPHDNSVQFKYGKALCGELQPKLPPCKVCLAIPQKQRNTRSFLRRCIAEGKLQFTAGGTVVEGHHDFIFLGFP